MRLDEQKCRIDFILLLLDPPTHSLHNNLHRSYGALSMLWVCSFSSATRRNTSGSVVLETLVLRRAVTLTASQTSTRLSLWGVLSLFTLPLSQSRHLTTQAPPAIIPVDSRILVISPVSHLIHFQPNLNLSRPDFISGNGDRFVIPRTVWTFGPLGGHVTPSEIEKTEVLCCVPRLCSAPGCNFLDSTSARLPARDPWV